MARQTQATDAQVERPAWLMPLLLFVGVAVSVSVTGSICMFVISLAAVDRHSVEAPAAVAQAEPELEAVPEPAVVEPSAKEAAEPPAGDAAEPLPQSPEPSHDVQAAVVEARPDEPGARYQTQSPVSPPSGQPGSVSDAIRAMMRKKSKQLTADQFPQMELPAAAVGYTFAPQQDLLAVVGPWESAVGFFSAEALGEGGSSGDARLVKLTGAPTAVTYVPRHEGGVFVVGQKEPHAAVFIDASSLEVLKTLATEPTWPGFLAAGANPDAPFVYACMIRGEAAVIRMDVNEMSVDEVWKSEFRDLAISPGGELVYHRRNGSPTGIAASRPRPASEAGGPASWEQVTYYHESTPPYYPHPNGRRVATGHRIYSSDLKQLILETEYDGQAFFKDRPLLAGTTVTDFVIGSANDGRILATVTLPDGWLGITQANFRKGVRYFETYHPAMLASVFADEKRNRFVLGMRERLMVFPLDRFELEEEPILAFTEMPAPRAMVGTQYVYSLATSAPDAEVELIKGPEGATIENGTLRWLPTSEQIGPVDLRLEISQGDHSADHAWQVTVTQNKLDVPFYALGCDPSTDGKQVVVWGHDAAELPAARRPNDRPKDAQLAIVDLETRRVVVQRKIDMPIAQAEFNAAGVYVTAHAGYGNDDMQVLRLSAENLSSLGQEEIEPGVLVSIADRIMLSRENRSIFQYSLPDLKPIEAADEARVLSGRPVRALSTLPIPAGRVRDGWLLNGVLWDEEMRTPRLIVDPPEFARLTTSRQPTGREMTPQGFSAFALQGPAPRADNWRENNARVTSHLPTWLTFKVTQGRAHLEFAEIHKKEVVRDVTLRARNTARQVHIETTSDHLLVTHGGETFVLPHGTDNPLPVPFHLVPRQSTLTLSTTRNNSVTYHAENAVKYELLIPDLRAGNESLHLESATGTFEFRVENISEILKETSETRGRPSTGGTAEWASSYQAANRERFRELLGRNPRGVPMLLNVFVRATGHDASVDVLQHAYFLEVPENEFGSSASRPQTASRAPEPTRRSSATRPAAPTELPATTSDQRTAAEYTEAFRRRMGSAASPLNLEQLKAEVAAADVRFLSRLSRTPAAPQVRTWTDTTGRTVQATFVELKDAVVVMIRDGDPQRTFQVPLERLSEADQQWVRSQAERPPMQAEPSPALSLAMLGAAIQASHDTYGSYPPTAIVADNGYPLLSWRVLLLQQLGYDSLAAAFKYDQPWNSAHNRQLIPLMPAVFRGDGELTEAGKTPYVAVVTQSATISDRYSTRAGDITDPKNKILVLTEASPERAPVWTRPADPTVNSSRYFNSILRSRNNRVFVCFADASVGTLPTDTPELEWKKLVSIRDGQEIDAAIEYLPNPPQP